MPSMKIMTLEWSWNRKMHFGSRKSTTWPMPNAIMWYFFCICLVQFFPFPFMSQGSSMSLLLRNTSSLLVFQKPGGSLRFPKKSYIIHEHSLLCLIKNFCEKVSTRKSRIASLVEDEWNQALSPSPREHTSARFSWRRGCCCSSSECTFDLFNKIYLWLLLSECNLSSLAWEMSSVLREVMYPHLHITVMGCKLSTTWEL